MWLSYKGHEDGKDMVKGRAELSELRSWESDDVMTEAQRRTKASHVLHECIRLYF